MVWLKSPEAASVPCTQRRAAQSARGVPSAGRLSAGLLGWNLGLTPIYLQHANALNSFGYR